MEVSLLHGHNVSVSEPSREGVTTRRRPRTSCDVGRFERRISPSAAEVIDEEVPLFVVLVNRLSHTRC